MINAPSYREIPITRRSTDDEVECWHCWNILVANSMEVMYNVITVLILGVERKGREPSAVKGLRFDFIQRAHGQLGKDF